MMVIAGVVMAVLMGLFWVAWRLAKYSNPLHG